MPVIIEMAYWQHDNMKKKLYLDLLSSNINFTYF